MNFFCSSVEQAINISRREKKPLLVFISDGTTTSTKYLDKYMCTGTAGELSTPEVLNRDYVCLKLLQGTAEFEFFHQLFSDVVVPSFYILCEGKVLDIITNSVEPKDFHTRILHIAARNRIVMSKLSTGASHQTSDESHLINGESQVTENNADMMKSVKVCECTRKREYEVRDERDMDEQLNQTTYLQHTNKIGGKKSSELRSESSREICTLSIKLLDGQSVVNKFAATSTLAEVREWLNNQSTFQVLPSKSSSLPSFAHSSVLEPSGFVFYHPGITRKTYTDEMELLTLHSLNLCPRSAIILKPTYDESSFVAYRLSKSPSRMLASLGGSFANLVHALYSFFDYSVDNHILGGYELKECDEDQLKSPCDSGLKATKDFDLPRKDVVISSTPIVSLDSHEKEPSLANIDSLEDKYSYAYENLATDSGSISSEVNCVDVSTKPNSLNASAVPSVTDIETLHHESLKAKEVREGHMKEHFKFSNKRKEQDEDDKGF